MIIHDILGEKNFIDLRSKLNNDSVWSDAPLTGCKDDKTFKNNKDYIGARLEEEFILVNSVQSNPDWRVYITAPKQSSMIFFLKYDENSHYKLHADTSRGFDGALHYTNIFFISDPDEYEGGELCLRINEEENKYKLKPNTLLTYPTSTEHWVLPVTKGVRYVGIFWTESYITEERDRKYLRELSKSYNLIRTFINKNIKEGSHWTSHELSEVAVRLETLAERVHQKYPRLRTVTESYLISE